MADKKHQKELEELRIRLQEAEETLEAIRTGAVDAIVVSGKKGEQVFTLQGADISYRLLVESISEGIIKTSGDGTILYSNKQFADLLGSPLEKVVGASFLEFIAKEDRGLVEESIRKHQGRSRFNVSLGSRKGDKIPVQLTFGLSGAEDSSLTAVVTDLSEQLRYLDIVKEEKLSKSIMENSPNGIAVCDTRGVIIRASKALNFFCSENVGMQLFDEAFSIAIVDALDKGNPPEAFSTRDILKGKALLNVAATLACPDNKTVYDITISAVPLRNDNDQIIGCLITIIDITESKRLDKELRQALGTFEKMFEGNAAAMALTRMEDGRILEVNDHWLKLTGFSREEVIGKTTFVLNLYKNPEDRDAIIRQIQQHGVAFDNECVCRRKNGEEWTALFSIQTLPLHNECVLISSAVDITERKKAEKETHEALERFYLALSSMTFAALLESEDNHVEFANQAFCDIFNLKESPDSLKGLTSLELFDITRSSYPDPDHALARIKEIVADLFPTKKSPCRAGEPSCGIIFPSRFRV